MLFCTSGKMGFRTKKKAVFIFLIQAKSVRMSPSFSINLMAIWRDKIILRNSKLPI